MFPNTLQSYLHYLLLPFANAKTEYHAAFQSKQCNFAALIFNAIIIPLLIPIALRGVKFKPSTATQLLRRNMLIYGVGGVVLPFIAIKAIDLILVHILAV
jgi:high-affinity K+ transport system ATPase subunit B